MGGISKLEDTLQISQIKKPGSVALCQHITHYGPLSYFPYYNLTTFRWDGLYIRHPRTR
jgi:hypothetical protein